MAHIFLETYWPAVAALLAAAAIWWSGNKRVDARIKWIALGTAGLGLLLGLVHLLVITDREKVIERTGQFVRSVAERNWNAVRALAHPDIRIYDWAGREDLVTGASKNIDRYGVRAAKVSTVDAHPEGREFIALLQVSAKVESSLYTGGIPSEWKLRWKQTPDGWQLYDVEVLRVWLTPASGVESHFRGRP